MKTILSIEDNCSTLDDIKTLIKTSISDERIRFLSINKGFNKINANTILKFRPDVIVLDIQLTGKHDRSGLDLARLIKDHTDTRHIPIIMLSLLKECQKMAEQENLCNVFLLKPCEPDLLFDHIQKFCKACV